MNLHEYQGKEILASFGVRVQRGIVAHNAQEAVEAAKQLTQDTGTSWHVIKAQVHAGGRGKGGGVKLAKNLKEVEEIAGQIIGMNLVTPQTSAEGKKVHQVLVAEDVYYPGPSETSEYYMSVLLNRAKGRTMIMYSPEGGMDIEEVAEKTPHLIYTEEVDPAVGLLPFQARRIAFNLGLSGTAFKEMTRFVMSLYRAYSESDASLFEINPVLKTSDNKILAVNCKVNLDDNALYRHKDYAAMRDTREENPIEVEAKEPVHESLVTLYPNVYHIKIQNDFYRPPTVAHLRSDRFKARCAKKGVNYDDICLTCITIREGAVDRAIRLKDKGIWLAGTTDQADQSLYDVDLSGPLALVMGSEGKGLRRLTAEHCDRLFQIPLVNDFDSLNVSAAAAITLYQVSLSQRG